MIQQMFKEYYGKEPLNEIESESEEEIFEFETISAIQIADFLMRKFDLKDYSRG